MPEPSCETCAALRRGGVTASPREVCPPEADALEVIAPGQGYSDQAQLRRCACGALYRYRYHHEYDVGGSWEERYLWRLEPEAERALGAVLEAERGEQAARLAPALGGAAEDLREHAALLLWCLASTGAEVDDALEAACRALEQPPLLARDFAYRALLSFLERGEDEAGLVHGWLTKLKTAERDPRYAWILLKECAASLGVD
ncbi:MAG: hypothetical protein KDD82_14290 [Planctomycetes bacterium]|nr:hypothetical protein [Planctomycetota bacterium]